MAWRVGTFHRLRRGRRAHEGLEVGSAGSLRDRLLRLRAGRDEQEGERGER